MIHNNLKLKTRIKLRMIKVVEKFIDYLFRVKILKVNNENINMILENLRKKENQFVGGKNEFQLKEIRVELINKCNTKCIMCPRESQKRKAGKMDITLYERLLKEAYDLGARALYPYHMGESLILRDFCEYIKIARDIGYTTIMLTTTGGLIKQYNTEELVTCGLTILNFSLDAVKQVTYEKIRKNMKLSSIENSIKKIIRVKKRINPKLEVSVKFMHYPGINDGEWVGFQKRWEHLADRIYYTIIHDWGGKTKFNVDNKLDPSDYCRYLRQKLIFGWDGTAMFCCMDYDNILPLGKYPDQSLKEIMKSPRLLEARRMHHEGKLNEHPMCKQCYMSLEEAVRNYYKKRFKNRLLSFSNKIRRKSGETI